VVGSAFDEEQRCDCGTRASDGQTDRSMRDAITTTETAAAAAAAAVSASQRD